MRRSRLRIFVAGATGAIGRPLVAILVRAGHEVIGMTRSPEKTELLRAAGAEPAVCDALDGAALRRTVAEAAPEVVIHELTDIPSSLDPRKYGEQMRGNDLVGREGTPNLMAAAVAAGAKRVVAQSVAFADAPVGEPVKTEDDPLFTEAPSPFRRSVRPGTTYASDGHLAREVRRRRLPIVGNGDGMFSFIHVEDAASATMAAAALAPPGIYNVVDDDPAPLREWLPVYAEVLGAKRPFRVPRFLARIVGGQLSVYAATMQRGASNKKARSELGWEPRYPSWRQGFREALG